MVIRKCLFPVMNYSVTLRNKTFNWRGVEMIFAVFA